MARMTKTTVTEVKLFAADHKRPIWKMKLEEIIKEYEYLSDLVPKTRWISDPDTGKIIGREYVAPCPQWMLRRIEKLRKGWLERVTLPHSKKAQEKRIAKIEAIEGPGFGNRPA